MIRIAFKPTSTISRKQKTVSRDGQDVDLIARGRHDPCVVPRAVPMVESMVALVLADQLLRVTPASALPLPPCAPRPLLLIARREASAACPLTKPPACPFTKPSACRYPEDVCLS